MSESKEASCSKTGEFGWNELVASDPTASGEFYAKLFGWKVEAFSPPGRPMGAPPYFLFKRGDEMLGGMVKPPQDSPSIWVPYVVVADVEVSFARALENGASVIVPVMSIGEIGRIAVVKDPQGAVIGLHEIPQSTGA